MIYRELLEKSDLGKEISETPIAELNEKLYIEDENGVLYEVKDLYFRPSNSGMVFRIGEKIEE